MASGVQEDHSVKRLSSHIWLSKRLHADEKFMRDRISPLGTPLAEANWRLITSLLLDKGKPFARLGRKATGQVIPDSRVTKGRIPRF